MNNQAFSRALLLGVLIGAFWAMPAGADYQAGLKAYERGDYKTAIREWRPLAGKGNVNAQFYLGLIHEMGFGTPIDLARAYAWYAEAAADGKHPRAVTAATRFKRTHPDAVRRAETIRARRRVEARQKAELERLLEERLRAEARALRRQDRRNRSSKPRQRKTKTQERLVFSLPPGWREGEAWAFSNAVTGARIDVLNIGSSTRLYQETPQAPDSWSELILLDTYRNNAAHSPETLYRQWRGRVMAGCHPGEGENPDGNRQKNTFVTTSFYTCAKLQTGPKGLHAMMKAVRGKKNVYFIRRFWRGASFPASERAAVKERFAGWGDWFAAVAMAKKKQTNIQPGNTRDTYVSGYGIVVSYLGHIITNRHLVRDCRKLRFSSRTAEPLASDPASGLVLFKRRRGTGGVASFRDVAELGKGDPVVLASNPHPGDFKKSKPKTELSVSAGVVDALSAPDGDRGGDGKGRFLSVTMPLVDELSGSPLLDLAGRVVGLAVARTAVGEIAGVNAAALEGRNFVIPAATIKRFMAAQGLSYKTSPAVENLTAGEAGDKARAYTVLVECWK